MTLEDVMALSHLAERIRAFARLPSNEQDKLFTAEELAASAARDELYDRYLQRQEQASAFIAERIEQDDSAKVFAHWLVRFVAAHELRCEAAGVPTETGSPLLILVGRETIDKFKAALRREIQDA